jgi:D-3-phosphoglycerate dehydrogenase
MVKDDVNFVNAEIMARERGIKVTETTVGETDEYINLISVRAISDEETSKVAGTIFGKKNPRVVNINNFRLELEPKGRFILIHNIDKPGAIGSIGTTLGDTKINISKMRVGQEEGGDKTVIFLRSDDPIPDDVMDKLAALPLNISVRAFEL